jgi:membrane associated rhomboid family serine protease/Zn-finger nucleic acid-binding protein
MRAAIERTPAGAVELDYCPSCRGIWFDRGELEAILLQVQSDIQPIGLPAPSDEPATRRCPHHQVLMVERTLSTARLRSSLYGAGSDLPDGVQLDQCPACLGIWLDGGELGQITQAMRAPSLHPLLKPSIEPPPPEAGSEQPTSGWLWAFMFLTGLPVESHQPRKRFPVVVMALVILCVMMFGVQAGSSHPKQLMLMLGLVPARALSGELVPWFSHMFLHGGVWHLLGNLYFLWVFGDNVEDRLGKGRFLLLYLASGLLAGLLQALVQPSSSLPVVGASGAISGVMAAYALLFPNARLVSLIWVIQVQWKTTTYLGVWLLLQFLGAAMGASNIAWWAHIGGFAAGAVIAWQWRNQHHEEVTRKLLPPSLPAGSGAGPGSLGGGSTDEPKRKLTWY